MINPDDLAMMNEEEKLDLLRQFAESDSWQESFEPICLVLIDDESSKVRQEAVAAFWDLADPRHVELLIRKAESDPDPDVRGKAAGVLGVFIYEAIANGALPESEYLAIRRFLLDLAHNEAEPLIVRRMAIEGLSFESDDEVMDLIDWAYHHPSVEARMSALFAMGRCRSTRWSDMLIAELDSPESRLQVEAINAVAESGLVTATPKLRNLAFSKTKEVRLAAIWALAQVNGPGVIETLEMCAQTEDEEVRRLANEAIDEYYRVENMSSESDKKSDDNEDDEPD